MGQWSGMHLGGGRSRMGSQRRLGGRLEGVAGAVGGGCCRLQTQLPPKLALAVWETAAEGGGGGTLPLSNASLPVVLQQPSVVHVCLVSGGTPTCVPVCHPCWHTVRQPLLPASVGNARSNMLVRTRLGWWSGRCRPTSIAAVLIAPTD